MTSFKSVLGAVLGGKDAPTAISEALAGCLSEDTVPRDAVGRPTGQFRGDGHGRWEYGDVQLQHYGDGEWSAELGTSRQHDYKNLSVEHASEQHVAFLIALRAIVQRYPEIEDYWIQFDGPYKPVKDVLKLQGGPAWKNLTFYHGTSSVLADKILKSGLSPRTLTGTKATHGSRGGRPSVHSDSVYLTVEQNPAHFAASEAAKIHGGDAVVLAITGFAGEPDLWLPDEDSGQTDALKSLQRIGNVAYRGVISPRFIKIVRRWSNTEDRWVNEDAKKYTKKLIVVAIRVVGGPQDGKILTTPGAMMHAQIKGVPEAAKKAKRLDLGFLIDGQFETKGEAGTDSFSARTEAGFLDLVTRERGLFIYKKDVEVNGVSFGRRARTERIVLVRIAKLEAAFQRSDEYVGPGGSGGIAGRYERFSAFLDRASAENIVVGVPEVSFTDSGNVSFINGRHRFAVMRDRGFSQIPISIQARDARRLKELMS